MGLPARPLTHESPEFMVQLVLDERRGLSVVVVVVVGGEV